MLEGVFVCQHKSESTAHWHELRFNEKLRLARAEATDDQHVFIPCTLYLLWSALHRQRVRGSEDDVVSRIWVNVWSDIPCRTGGPSTFIPVCTPALRFVRWGQWSPIISISIFPNASFWNT